MSNISIPEPCHENWADFTPTEKGAFCGSCQIDVVDFSNKTPDEVKTILKENAGKHLCGRFRKSQLDDLNNEFAAWENQSVKSFQSKFLYACLIVFGMTLFTSCNVSEQNLLSEFGIELNENNDEANLQITKLAAEYVEKDTTKKDKNHYRKGKIKYVPEETPEEKEAVELILGKPAIEKTDCETPPDSLNNVQDEPSTVDSLYNDQMIDGGMVWTPQFEEFIEDSTADESVNENSTDSTIIEEIHVKGEIQITEPVSEEPEQELIIDSTESDQSEATALTFPSFDMVFDAQLYPNPVKDQANVVINVKDPQIFNVYLYAINGKMVKDIYNGMLASGRQEFLVDLTGYESGSYLIVINAGKQKESLKLEKLR